MKKILITLLLQLILLPANAFDFSLIINDCQTNKDIRAVKKVLKSQVKYANKNDFNKFISTYDEKYVNGDGFNLDIYSTLVKDLWALYDGIEYDVEIKNVLIKDNIATVELIETSYADLPASHAYSGELKSIANSIYKLHKINNEWKVISDSVIDETTSMLYGAAKDLDVVLNVPIQVNAGTDYTATLEFETPKEMVAIASIAADRVEYPQKPTQEVFRAMPEDNILERIFTSNNDNVNEYIVASIGLTKTSLTPSSLNLSLMGFGYTIRRVNVIPIKEKSLNDKDK